MICSTISNSWCWLLDGPVRCWSSTFIEFDSGERRGDTYSTSFSTRPQIIINDELNTSKSSFIIILSGSTIDLKWKFHWTSFKSEFLLFLHTDKLSLIRKMIKWHFLNKFSPPLKRWTRIKSDLTHKWLSFVRIHASSKFNFSGNARKIQNFIFHCCDLSHSSSKKSLSADFHRIKESRTS